MTLLADTDARQCLGWSNLGWYWKKVTQCEILSVWNLILSAISVGVIAEVAQRGKAYYSTFLSTCDDLNQGVSIQVRRSNRIWSLLKKPHHKEGYQLRLNWASMIRAFGDILLMYRTRGYFFLLSSQQDNSFVGFFEREADYSYLHFIYIWDTR